MDSLFPVVTSDVHELDIPPELEEFFGELSACGLRDPFLGFLLKERVARTIGEAITLLGSIAKHGDFRDLRIACADFKRGSGTNTVRRLLRAAEEAEADDGWRLYGRYGTMGHQAIAKMLAMPKKRRVRSRPNQPPLFDRDPKPQLPFQPRLFEVPSQEVATATLWDRWPSDRYLCRLETCWQSLVSKQASEETWHGQTLSVQDGLPELARLLLPYFGESLAKISGVSGGLGRYLSSLTLLSWAGVLLYLCRSGPRPMFCEVPVLPSEARVSGGRVDAIEVVSVDGRALSEKEARFLSELARLKSFRSVSQLKGELRRYLGSRVSLVYHDWKFAVGDGIRKGQVLKASDIGHLPPHKRQISRYLTLAAFSEQLFQEAPPANSTETLPGGAGTLVYLMPAEGAIEEEVQMSPEEILDYFAEHFAGPWMGAVENARKRSLGNQVAGFLRALDTDSNHEGNGNGNGHGNGNGKKKNGGNVEQPPLLEGLAQVSVRELIESAERYLDDLRILKVVGNRRDGRPRLLLHAERLLEAVKAGQVPAGYTALPESVTVSCLAPEHEDSTPSMRVDFEKGVFYCYGCGRGGSIDPRTLPRQWQLGVSQKTYGRRDRKESVVIPERTSELFSQVQAFLSEAFPGSPAEEYMLFERGIPPGLAGAYGAGYPDERLYHKLLEARWTLNDLAQHGLVAFSPKVPSTGGLVPVLRAHRNWEVEGRSSPYRLRDLWQPTKSRDSRGRVRYGYPYSPLANRVSFPLMYMGRVTNFYGRAILNCDRRFRHRKLTRVPGVPQGGFNLGVLDLADDIVLVEGVMDALTLIACGYPVIAVIGVKNKLIIEEVARRARRIGIGLDNDAAGINVTEQLFRDLKGLRYQGEVYDFTAQFVCSHYGASVYDDYNSWWMVGRRLSRAP